MGAAGPKRSMAPCGRIECAFPLNPSDHFDGVTGAKPSVPRLVTRGDPSLLRPLGQHVRLDLIAVGQLVHLIEQSHHRQHLAQGFVVEAHLL